MARIVPNSGRRIDPFVAARRSVARPLETAARLSDDLPRGGART
jgi:hypothetical protein